MSATEQTPEFLEYLEDGLHQFSYDHDARLFTIAGKEILVTDELLLREFSFPSGDTTPLSDLPNHPVYYGYYGLPLMTKKFSDWVRVHVSEKEIFSTKMVIHEVAEQMTGIDLDHPPTGPNIESIFGAEVFLQRAGHLTFQTIGNCACMGIEVSSHLVPEQEFDSGYGEYGFHNVYEPSQKISLLAGLGHMATLCTRQTV